MPASPLLAIDFGTSNTVAVLRQSGAADRPLLFSGSPVMPSAVYLDDDGRFHTGREAGRMAQLDPAAFEPHPKQHLGEDLVLLGAREVPAADMAAAVLGRVRQAAVEVAGEAPPAVLTHPAQWGPRRIAALERAAAAAGLDVARLVAEPVAAAHRFAQVEAVAATAGPIGVFDLGGGTFDIAVLRRDRSGRFAVAAQGGQTDLGGVDLDQAIVGHLGGLIEQRHPELWRRISRPGSAADRRAHRQFRDDVREAKEMLSQSPMAPIALPGLDTALHLTRDEVDRLAAPLAEAAVALTGRVIAEAGCAPSDLAGLFLVGGASRMPLVGRVVHRRLGVAPTVLEQPELAVAQGALDAAEQPEPQPQPEPTAVGAPAEPEWLPPSGTDGVPPEPVAAQARTEWLPTSGDGPPVAPVLPPPPPRSARPTVFAACLGAFLVLADFTTMAVAAPAIGRELDADAAALPWVLGGYAGALAALLLAVGPLMDRWGLKRTYLAGLAGFALASIVCLMSPDLERLIAARVLQGAAAAAVLAPATALVRRARRERGLPPAFGVWGAVAAAAAVAGPVLGGAVTGYLGARTVFLAGALVGLVAIAVGAAAVAEPGPVKEGRLSLLRSARPGFAGAALAALLISAAAFSHLVYTSIWIQTREVGLGSRTNTPVEGALALMPMAAAALAAAVLARALRRVPSWIMVGSGLALIGLGGLMQSGLGTDGWRSDAFAHLQIGLAYNDWRSGTLGLLMIGAGVGLCVPALNAAAAAAVPEGGEVPAARALNASAQAGLVLGIAVLGAVVAAHALGQGGTADPFTGDYLDGASVVNALRPAMTAAGWIALAGAIPAALLVRQSRREAPEEPSPAASG